MYYWIQHHMADSIIAAYIISAAISTMPQPEATSGKAYSWLYHFLHVASANLDQYFRKPLPPA